MNHQKFNRALLCLSLYLFSFHTVYAVEIKATVDRNPVSINESFQIIFSATKSPDDDPDFSPLENNFTILNQQHRNNSSWANGQSTKSIQWVLNVMAKRPGNLLIPPITFGDDISQSAAIKVTRQIAPKQTNNTDLYIDVKVSSQTPYVQSQIIYTLSLYRRVQLSQASLTEPKMKDAVIEKLTEDRNYETEINNVTYAVTERKYAIFPQKSGVVTITPSVLTAEIVVPNNNRRFNSFFNRQATKTKRIKSKAITLNVQAAPASFKAKQWIPAELVHIEEKWSGDINNMKLGEPLTRTITLLAKGTTVAQLPELQNKITSSGLKTYPDQPLLKEKKQADGIIAFREEKIAYIPSKPGIFTLPALEIPWFNIQTKQMEIARIPEVTITAVGMMPIPQSTTETISPIPSNTVTNEFTVSATNNLWFWLSLVLAIGWVATLLFFLRKQQNQQKEPLVNKQEMSLKKSIKNLKHACNTNDSLAAKNALLAWGEIKYNSVNLSAIASCCEARLRDEIHILSQTLYAKQSTPWQGKKLFQYFTENNTQEKLKKRTTDELEPLYKV